MELNTYLDLMKKQHDLMTPEQKNAICEQLRLHKIAAQKMQIRDEFEERYRELFAAGYQKLLSEFPQVLELLPSCDNEIDMFKSLYKNVLDTDSELHRVTARMKSIPEFIECEKLNVKVAKAHFDFFCANEELNRRIDSDRDTLFVPEYREKMRQFADDGVLLYFLETPDQPLLESESTADYILESFSFGDYLNARILLSSFNQSPNPGLPLQRKLEDAYAALEMMFNGCYRSAARNWFALVEHEHKRCADTLEGYWETKKEYKNGGQRSEKIYKIIEGMMSSWDQEAWSKIDSYYKKITANQKNNDKDKALNRNSIIHGDYYSNAIDVSENDAIRLFLLWINLRVMTDHLAFFEDFMRNKVTLLPYFCSVLPGTD